MDTDTLIKILDLSAKITLPLLAIILPLIAQFPSARAGFKTLKYFQRDRYKQDSEFAYQLFERYRNPSVKRYAEDLGYAALIGDDRPSFEEKCFLISLEYPRHIIDRYLQAQSLVEIDIHQQRFVWKHFHYASTYYRGWIKAVYLLMYFICCLFAFSPYILWSFKGTSINPSTQIFVILILSCIFFLFFAAFFLRQSYRLDEGEKLISMHKITAVRLVKKTRVRQWLADFRTRFTDYVLIKK